MSLRTVFSGAFDTKLAEARTAGKTFIVTTNLAAINSDMTIAANQGKKVFTLTYTATYQPSDLRLLGSLWKAFQTGVIEGLASEDLMINEVEISLNTADTLSTKIDLKFDFNK
jgi:hypothetical protein